MEAEFYFRWNGCKTMQYNYKLKITAIQGLWIEVVAKFQHLLIEFLQDIAKYIDLP